MWKEFYIQSNIPLIILTIAVLCLLFIGYLEVKKLNIRIDNLNNRVENFSVNSNSQDLKLELKEDLDETKILNDNSESESGSDSGSGSGSEESLKDIPKKENNDESVKDDNRLLSEEILQKHNMMMMDGGPPIHEIVIGGGGGPMFGFPPMGGIIGGMMFEENITGEVQKQHENTITELEDEENKIEEIKEEKHSSSSESEESEESGEEESGEEESGEEESGEESEEDIEIVLSNAQKMVSKDMSIKELKEICLKMDLSTSGNKRQLIDRINQKSS